MVLNTTGMSSLFPQSGAEGDGMNPNAEERIREAASKLRLMYSGEGETTSAAEIQLDSHTFERADFLTTDMILIEYRTKDSSAGGAGAAKIRLTIGTTSSDGEITIGQGKYANGWIMLTEKETEGWIINGSGLQVNSDGLVSSRQFGYTFDTALKHAIKEKFTISFRGNVNTSGTLYFKWWISRKGAR